VIPGLGVAPSGPRFRVGVAGRRGAGDEEGARNPGRKIELETPLERLEQFRGGHPVGKIVRPVDRGPKGQARIRLGDVDGGSPEGRDLRDRAHEPAQELLGVAADLEVLGNLEQGHRPPAHPPPLSPEAGETQGHFLEFREVDGLGEDIVDGLADEAGQGIDVEGARHHQDGDVEVGLPDPLHEVVPVPVLKQVVDEDEIEGRFRIGGETVGETARADRLPALCGEVALEELLKDHVVIDEEDRRLRPPWLVARRGHRRLAPKST
jgi:hypothetical protein